MTGGCFSTRGFGRPSRMQSTGREQKRR